MTSSTEETYVGPYRLLAHIGEGGMGVVHLAQGPDGARVALKVLRPHVVGDAEARERLAQEVSSLRRISSPRVAEILDADPHGPLPYVVTRYVPGLSLYHHVAEEGLIEGAALLHFAGALAEALQAVHASGVLHRDIKPTNVLMEGRWPVLIDFGLARVAEDPRLTQTGFLLGTPGYLAPEILYGDDATVASDVHAWAATVVYAATGRPPYGTGPTMAVMDRVRRGEHDLSGIPDPLNRLLAAGLAAEPLDRPTVRRIIAWVQAETERSTTRRVLEPVPQPAPELWTMPLAPRQRDAHRDPQPEAPTAARPETHPEAPTFQQPEAPTFQQPAPATSVLPVAAPDQRPQPDQPVQHSQPVHPGAPAPGPRRASRGQQVLQLLGLGALAGAIVAYAPYLGLALVALVVLVLRTVSVGRQRHGRRRMVRGRARWYDVPTTTLATPGYLVIATFGTVSLVTVAAVLGLALFSLAYLLGQSVTTGLLMAGAAFAPGLWWGPGSGRVRETTRRCVDRTSRTELVGWFVAVMALLGSAALVAVLLRSGVNWAPSLQPPWR